MCYINTDCRQNLAGIPDLQSTNQSFLLKHPLYIDTRVTWRPILCCNIHSLDHQLLIELCWECSTARTSFRGATISCATVQLADAPCKTALIQRWPMTVYTVCVRFTGQQLQYHWGILFNIFNRPLQNVHPNPTKAQLWSSRVGGGTYQFRTEGHMNEQSKIEPLSQRAPDMNKKPSTYLCDLILSECNRRSGVRILRFGCTRVMVPRQGRWEALTADPYTMRHHVQCEWMRSPLKIEGPMHLSLRLRG